MTSTSTGEKRGRPSCLAALWLVDSSVVTSGAPERFADLDGRRYHHLLDPATGSPFDSGLAAVTAVSADSLTADAWPTHRVAPAPLAPGASATATLLLRRVINHQPGRTTLPLARPGSGSALDARTIRRMYGTAAAHLVESNGAVAGVLADRQGQRIAIKAKRAVVLTCGGFENNPPMVRTYINALPHVYPVGTPYNTGDGIRMAQEVGADLWHMSNIAGPELFFKAPELSVGRWISLPHVDSYIFVAADGKRFIAEGDQCMGTDRHGKFNYHGMWMQQIAPMPVHLIFDESFRVAGCIGNSFCCWDVIHGNQYNWSKDNLREVEKGWIKKANSIRELAGLVGLSAEVLETTVTRYNTFAAHGEDADFGRNPAWIAAIETPPFCAMELTPCFVNTQGGPRRNEDAQVIALDGRPIPRLCSAGELGSIYAYNYNVGGNVGECFAFGRVAGRSAAREMPIEETQAALSR